MHARSRPSLASGPVRAAVVLVTIFVVFGATAPNFLTSFNIRTLLAFAVPAALIAVGQTIVMIEGEIDLSVAAIAVLAGIVTIELQPSGIVIALLAGVMVGVAVGLFNGVLTAYVGIVSLVATLASLFIAQGLAFAVANKPVSGTRLDLTVKLDDPLMWMLTPRLLLGLGLVVAASVALSGTAWGRTLFARGANPRSAELLGLAAKRAVLAGFVASGTLSAIAGIVLAIALNSASPVIGGDLLLLGIAAALIGGATLKGGSGSIVGTVLALIALVALANGMDKLHVTPYLQTVVRGTVVLIALLLAGREDAGIAQIERLRNLGARFTAGRLGTAAAPPP